MNLRRRRISSLAALAARGQVDVQRHPEPTFHWLLKVADKSWFKGKIQTGFIQIVFSKYSLLRHRERERDSGNQAARVQYGGQFFLPECKEYLTLAIKQNFWPSQLTKINLPVFFFPLFFLHCALWTSVLFAAERNCFSCNAATGHWRKIVYKKKKVRAQYKRLS